MKWQPFRFTRKADLRRPFHRKAALRLEELESRLAPSVNVLTFHNDIASTGLNPSETQLTPTNVKVGSFDKLFVTTVDGQVYAEPLVDTGITINAGVNTKPGAAGVHDVVFVATEHDSLYAINASAGGGAILWQRTFLDSTNPGAISTVLSPARRRFLRCRPVTSAAPTSTQRSASPGRRSSTRLRTFFTSWSRPRNRSVAALISSNACTPSISPTGRTRQPRC